LANDYGRAVGMVTSPSAFLGGFVRGVNRLAFTQQVRGHPPGIVLALWALGRLGARGAWAEAAFFIACGAAMVPATLVALRDVAGEAAARTAAPFVALAPAALWVATTGDALVAGVAAWAVSLTVLATSRGGRHADVLAVAGGLLVGAALLASYAAPLFMLPAIAVAAQRRRARVLILAAAVALVVVALLRVGGFWWPDGLRATLRAYRLGVSQFRPQSYFWFGNLAAFALVVGPATAVALARLRDRRVWVLVVEDDSTVADVVQRYLERDGFTVGWVRDGAVGLERAARDPPDLVILDLMLPGLDGMDVCRRLRAVRPVPVIILTAKGQEAD